MANSQALEELQSISEELHSPEKWPFEVRPSRLESARHFAV